ncbi:hypothetical protein M6D81_15385 [Paenibacillus sp. J5C_2022]|uniref:hypothetical protein n=1 Tax=Paenibacillus sp. J5C2022 TaxID=2977129 RepID=UPI0021D1696F|nr:hypothetical protein [Paenibacillus sp. J5C2022]MCU6710079.1 hypothetical protein [Paenibacillus sp. J5C2022]
MPDLQTYLDYQDKNIIIWRKGTAQDPFKPKADSLPIINGIMTLLEVPSESHGVHIPGFIEVPFDKFKRKTTLAQQEFVVDYSSGIVQFHTSHEAKSFIVSYMGKGHILYPASRIYAMVQRNPDIVITLQDYIDELKSLTNDLDLKLIEMDEALLNVGHATQQANTATDNANLAADNANVAAEQAQHAADSTVVIRKPPVDSYEDISSTYPSPENGWQTTINTTGDIYRYNGFSGLWELVGSYLGGSIPYASEDTDGLMRREDYQKLGHLTEELSDRVITFLIPSYLSVGVQGVLARFPFDGIIVEINAICSTTGVQDLVLDIEKSSDVVNWTSILTNDVKIAAGSLFDDSTHFISDSSVVAGDIFRINIAQNGDGAKDLTVEVRIKLN